MVSLGREGLDPHVLEHQHQGQGVGMPETRLRGRICEHMSQLRYDQVPSSYAATGLHKRS